MPKTTDVPKSTRRGRDRLGNANAVDVHVGHRIALRRSQLGLTREALGKRVGISFQQVQKYETAANRVGASRLYDLASALDVPVGFFFDDMGQSTAQGSPRHISANRGAGGPGPREISNLVKDYSRIVRPDLRRRVADLARFLANSESNASPLPNSDGGSNPV